MSTTIRVKDEDKSLLDQLQAKWTLAHGTRISLDGLLHRILRLASRHEDELLRDAGPEALDDQDRKAILALASNWDRKTEESTIDQELYGHDAAQDAEPEETNQRGRGSGGEKA